LLSQLRSLLSHGALAAALFALSTAGAEDCLEDTGLYLDAAHAIRGRLDYVFYAGEEPALEVVASLRTDLSTDYGIAAWAVSVAHDPAVLEIVEATHAGTDVEALFGFVKTAIVDNETGTGFVSARVLSCSWCDPFPSEIDASLARARYLLVPNRALLDGTPVATAIRFQDGLRGPGQPVENIVVHNWEIRIPCDLQDLEIEVRFANQPPFMRGDANFDQALDISDPVTILWTKFLEASDAPIQCDDAADSNDDGVVDISDAIYIFSYLYLGGPRPPAPFPGTGRDASEDDLGCRPR